MTYTKYTLWAKNLDNEQLAHRLKINHRNFHKSAASALHMEAVKRKGDQYATCDPDTHAAAAAALFDGTPVYTEIKYPTPAEIGRANGTVPGGTAKLTASEAAGMLATAATEQAAQNAKPSTRKGRK